jgi:hypothetical protein
VTLLLCNACAMEALPLFLDTVTDPATAIIVSVTAVLVFGEVLPQAVCSRWGRCSDNCGNARMPTRRLSQLYCLGTGKVAANRKQRM